MSDRICSVEGCERPHKARGWCMHHYDERRRGVGLSPPPTIEERFWSQVDSSGDCWLWTGALGGGGYGQFGVGQKVVYAHRWAYEQSVGPIPEGLDLDHVCHSIDRTCPRGDACPHRRCVRLDHLEPVTRRENLLRGWHGLNHHLTEAQ